MTNTTGTSLSPARAAALYIGALLGPSLLLLPGLAAAVAGPASILAWGGLLALSGLLAWVFTRLGSRITSRGGVSAYTTAGLGPTAGRMVGWCFLAGAVAGAPVVCLIGGSYVAVLFDGGRLAGVACAGVLLVLVVAMTMGGARASAGAQLVLIAVLIALVVVAVVGSAPAERAANWAPFAPHGWAAVGRAASLLMLSFVGWEAIAPLTARLSHPARQLPRVIGIAFAVTSLCYLALAAATIGVLGAGAGTAVPLAELLRVAVGRVGVVAAAIAAVALTLAATNAYLSGAAALAADLRAAHRPHPPVRGFRLQLGVAVAGLLVLGGVGAGVVTTEQLVAIPTTFFLAVYLGCTAAATRILTGAVRIAAAVACAAVLGVLAFSGWALLPAAAVALAAAFLPRSALPVGPRRRPHAPKEDGDVAVESIAVIQPAERVGNPGQ